MKVPSRSPYAASIGFSAAVRAGDLIAVAGQTALTADGDVVGGDDPYLQAVEALRKLREALAAAGGDVDAVVLTRIFITAREHTDAVARAHGEVFADVRPAATMVVCDLLDERMLVEIEALARVTPPG